MRMRSLAVAAVCLLGCEQLAPPTEGGSPAVATSGATGKKARAIELSGGTVAVAGGGRFAVATDPDRDTVWVVDLTTGQIHGHILLAAGSQPERAIEDGDGRVRVALRGTGQVVTISPSTMAVLETIDVCPEVRGLSFSKTAGTVLVACEGGELVTIKGTGVISTSHPATDLRDAVETGGKLWVSRFRAANLVEVDSAGKPTGATVQFPSLPIGTTPSSFAPAVAYRTIVAPNGNLITAHQRVVDGDISSIQVPSAPPARPYYQNTCSSSIVHSTVSVADPSGKVIASEDIAGVLPIDLAISPDGSELAVAQPGSRFVQRLATVNLSNISGGICTPTYPDSAPVGQVTGVAFTPQNELVVHTREPMAVWTLGTHGVRTQKQILLTNATIDSPGHALFHNATGAIACASCHPEGTDDGHVWTLFQQTVRTQSLSGGVIATAPFHWSGSIPDLKGLLDDTFVARMGAKTPTPATVDALSDWMDQIPARKLAAPAVMATAAHGKDLFNDASVGCANCHSGELLTNNQTLDVGTGGKFQVPSLRGVSLRGPWMHDGCAQTLKDRFGACGGKAHGETGRLAPDDIDALVAYLGTL
jgi:DNA-binding beta-propeller fold protein YncE